MRADTTVAPTSSNQPGDKLWAKKFPELGTEPIEAEPLISPEFFELERERVFRPGWLCVGHSCEIPAAGDYLVKEIAVCDASILVMRGPDGVVRGFHNVCSHRGNKLRTDPKGNCRGYLTCGFHGWTYDTRGQLRSVPDERNFFNLNKSENGLTPVATEVWNGFIFISLAPRESFKQYIDGVGTLLDGGDFGQLTLRRRYLIEERANWKTALDAQNEGYHVATQHRYMIPRLFTSTDEGQLRSADVRFFKRHSLLTCALNPECKPTQLEMTLGQIGNGATQCRLPMQGALDFYLVFPNFVLLFFRGRAHDSCVTHNFWPLAVDRTLWEIRFYEPAPQDAAALIGQDFGQVWNRVIFDEDASAHETVQAGLKSRAKKYLILQDEEAAVRYFHKVVEEHVGPYKRA
jgi:phenylpropionate dioxygenase-like ring-hydroxylating dioxygenase large terminal subunit